MTETTKVLSLTRSDWTYSPADVLGRGSFGTVYRGFLHDGVPVAVKVLRSGGAPARREFDLAGLLLGRQFIYVLPILDVGYDPVTKEYALVMPLADRSLQDEVVNRGQLEEAQAVSVLYDVVRGLSEISSQDIVHRDLKPSNILLHEGRWKLSDFSISRLASALTADETLKQWLSFPYAAPEQWEGKSASTATDIYSMGCIAHFMISGGPPFEGTMEEVRKQHLNCAPGKLDRATPSYRGLVERCMRKNPDARPKLARLTSVIETIGLGVVNPDSGASQLAAIGALKARRNLEQEAAQKTRLTIEEERTALSEEAFQILDHCREKLFSAVVERVPGILPMSIEEVRRSHATPFDMSQLFNRDPTIPGGDRPVLLIEGAVLDFDVARIDLSGNIRRRAPKRAPRPTGYALFGPRHDKEELGLEWVMGSNREELRLPGVVAQLEPIALARLSLTRKPFITKPRKTFLDVQWDSAYQVGSRENFGEVDRLLLYRRNVIKGDYRWYEHCRYVQTPQKVDVAPSKGVLEESQKRSNARRRFFGKPRRPESVTVGQPDSNLPQHEESTTSAIPADVLIYHGPTFRPNRFFLAEGLPIDDEDIYSFIDHWMLIVAKMLGGKLNEVFDADVI